MRVKIFQSSSPDEVQDKTNEWLETNGKVITVDHTQFAIAKENTTLFGVAIWYESLPVTVKWKDGSKPAAKAHPK